MESINDSKGMSENYVNLNNNTIYIGGLFDNSIMSEVIPNIDNILYTSSLMSSESKKLIFNINSLGGDTSVLISLLTKMDEARAEGFKIITQNLGYSASCGSILAIYGDKGSRLMGRYARQFIHHFSHSFEINSELGIKKRAEEDLIFSEIYKQIYLDHSKFTKKQLDYVLDGEGQVLNANECLKYGLVDKII